MDAVPLCPSVTELWKPRLEGEEQRVPEGGRLALSSFSVPWHLVDIGKGVWKEGHPGRDFSHIAQLALPSQHCPVGVGTVIGYGILPYTLGLPHGVPQAFTWGFG